MSNFKFGNGSRAKLYGTGTVSGVHPDVAAMCVSALRYSTVDFSITDGYRSVAQQQAMFSGGHSELDGINKRSDHQRRLAIDIYPVVKQDGIRLDMYNVDSSAVRNAWLEVYRAFMRASMKHKLFLEFGVGYNIGNGRDWPHISIKGRRPLDYSGMSEIV